MDIRKIITKGRLFSFLTLVVGMFGCQSKQLPTITSSAQTFYDTHQSSIVDAILDNYFAHTEMPEKGTCQMKLLGGDEEAIFVWSICNRFINEEKVRSSFSRPVKISFHQDQITKVEAPRDGGANRSDVEQLFPKDVIKYYFDNQKRMSEIVRELDQ